MSGRPARGGGGIASRDGEEPRPCRGERGRQSRRRHLLGLADVYAPVEVRVFESGKLLGTSLDGKLLISAGPHEVELVNKRLGYRETRKVEIEPGKDTALSVQAPNGTVVIEAPDGTEVLVDGQPAGMMPIEKLTAPIGTRNIVLKHPALGTRRVTVTVGVDVPARVSLMAPQ